MKEINCSLKREVKKVKKKEQKNNIKYGLTGYCLVKIGTNLDAMRP